MRRSFLFPQIVYPFFFFLLILAIAGFFTQRPVLSAASSLATPQPTQTCLFNPTSTQIRVQVAADGSWQAERLWQSGTVGKTIHRNLFSGDSPDALQSALFDDPCGLTALRGAMTLEIQGTIVAGQVINLNLPANPSTGYFWEIDETATALHLEANQMHQISNRIGGAALQTLTFRSPSSAKAKLRLHYQRPWQEQEAPILNILIEGQGVSIADLSQAISLPAPPSTFESSALSTPTEGSPLLEDPVMPQSATELPSSFNWCAQGKCTPVRNQGACGSCWAFSTVGVLESKMLIVNNPATDLSEQYLVSCNLEGWGCDGGWFAHDYHISKKPPSETQAGAVLESAFPYRAADLPCNGPYQHPYRATEWKYVDPKVNIPIDEQIKQAIYTYGPVAAAVCAGPAFDRYRGGVFVTDEKSVCGSSLVNHGIVLTGWDDSQGVWILRNSWGSSWGESGYMRIGYGVSNVGLGANYISYSPSADIPPTATATPSTSPSPTPSPTSSPPFVIPAHVYLPLLSKASTDSISPLAGYWLNDYEDSDFYVTADRAHVTHQSVIVYISDGVCQGQYWQITAPGLYPIRAQSYSFDGAYYAQGRFTSPTTAIVQHGLLGLYIEGCGTFSSDLWTDFYSWNNNTQPLSAKEQGQGTARVKTGAPIRPIYLSKP